jgi:vacuolar-type H+-ATPase subunit E/Vma4
MSLEKILNTIIEDAQTEAVEVVKESQNKAEEIKDAARQEAEVLAAAIQMEGERLGRLEASRLITQARLEGRIDILSTKKEIIENILKEALDRERSDIKTLKRTIIMKGGEKEEAFDESRLLEKIRPQMEKLIYDTLKL